MKQLTSRVYRSRRVGPTTPMATPTSAGADFCNAERTFGPECGRIVGAGQTKTSLYAPSSSGNALPGRNTMSPPIADNACSTSGGPPVAALAYVVGQRTDSSCGSAKAGASLCKLASLPSSRASNGALRGTLNVILLGFSRRSLASIVSRWL